MATVGYPATLVRALPARGTGAGLLVRVDGWRALDFPLSGRRLRHDGGMFAVVFDTNLFEAALCSASGPGQRQGMVDS